MLDAGCWLLPVLNPVEGDAGRRSEGRARICHSTELVAGDPGTNSCLGPSPVSPTPVNGKCRPHPRLPSETGVEGSTVRIRRVVSARDKTAGGVGQGTRLSRLITHVRGTLCSCRMFIVTCRVRDDAKRRHVHGQVDAVAGRRYLPFSGPPNSLSPPTSKPRFPDRCIRS